MKSLLKVVACLFLCVSLNSFAALSIRDLDGDWSNGFEGVYDDVLDITWSADANYFVSNSHLWPNYIGQKNGVVGIAYTNGKALLNDLNIGDYNGWRFPSLRNTVQGSWRIDSPNEGEMEHMFLVNLGHPNNGSNSSFIDANDGNTYSFINAGAGVYYYDEIYGGNHNYAYAYHPGEDGTLPHRKTFYNSKVWLVHDGDIGLAPVPLPAGIYLFLSGLVGLGLMRGRNG